MLLPDRMTTYLKSDPQEQTAGKFQSKLQILNWGNAFQRVVCKMLAIPLQWRHNGRDGVSNHQPHGCLLNHFNGRRSKKTQSSASLAFVPVTGKFPSQRASNAKKGSIWWRHNAIKVCWIWSLFCSHFVYRRVVYEENKSNWQVVSKYEYMLYQALISPLIYHHVDVLQLRPLLVTCIHDDVIKWKQFPCYWPILLFAPE